MHISFSGRGKGSCIDAVKYLLQEKDSKGVKREEVVVLRGDPQSVADVADGLNFVHRYTLGVIGFSPEDNPTDVQIDDVLNEFEKTSWAGLDFDQYDWTAVLHRDSGGGCHVHVLAANVELDTKKKLNIAPPGWIGTYKHLRNWKNWQNSWERPDDPKLARILRKPKHVLFDEAQNLRLGLKNVKDPRDLLNDIMLSEIQSGKVKNRETLVESLVSFGFEIPRQGRDYVTVKVNKTGQKWRLKGAIYGKDWTITDDVSLSSKSNLERAEESKKMLNEKRAKRAKYNRERYGKRDNVILPPRSRSGQTVKYKENSVPADFQVLNYLRELRGKTSLDTSHFFKTTAPWWFTELKRYNDDRVGNPFIESSRKLEFATSRSDGAFRATSCSLDRTSYELERISRKFEKLKKYDPNWRIRIIEQRQYYILYERNVQSEIIKDFQLWENENGRFLKNKNRDYHIWDKGDTLILRKAVGADRREAVRLMLEIASDKKWDLSDCVKTAFGSEEFKDEVKKQVTDRLERQTQKEVTRWKPKPRGH